MSGGLNRLKCGSRDSAHQDCCIRLRIISKFFEIIWPAARQFCDLLSDHGFLPCGEMPPRTILRKHVAQNSGGLNFSKFREKRTRSKTQRTTRNNKNLPFERPWVNNIAAHKMSTI